MKKLAMVMGAILLFSELAFSADPGVTDKEVVIGGHSTESGTWAMLGVLPKAMEAYFDRVNAHGGIDGRKIKYIHIDTQNDSAKSVQATHKLVEEDKVFAVVGAMGTSHQAVWKYL